MSIVVDVAGNIGAGKSSFCRVCEREVDGVLVHLEPDRDDNPHLRDFYKDRERVSAPMQQWMLIQRYDAWVKASKEAEVPGRVVLLDRSVFSDVVFLRKNARDGAHPAKWVSRYNALREEIMRHAGAPDAFLHLKVDPAECHRRVTQVRGNAYEAGIPLEYLAGLDAEHAVLRAEMLGAGHAWLDVDWDRFGNAVAVLDRLPAPRKRDQLDPAWVSAMRGRLVEAYAEACAEAGIPAADVQKA